MDIVIDTSVLIAVILNEPEKAELVKLTAGHTLVGPESIRWEIGNAFSAMFKKDRITLRMAQQAMSIFEVIPIRYMDVDFKHLNSRTTITSMLMTLIFSIAPYVTKPHFFRWTPNWLRKPETLELKLRRFTNEHLHLF
jgi:predicted nucleic acid-binding protein